jgi:hypothetical protein
MAADAPKVSADAFSGSLLLVQLAAERRRNLRSTDDARAAIGRELPLSGHQLVSRESAF